MNTNGAPVARRDHTAVWTGSEMIVWGGYNGSYLNDGGRYNPAGDSWTQVTTNGAPARRHAHTTVWTGSEMIVWGGNSNATTYAAGGRYNPATNIWASVTTNGAPGSRFSHTAVWTGKEMIIWGGTTNASSISYFNNGGRYNPIGNTWTAVTANGAPIGRSKHTAVWTGNEMIVWGGFGYDNLFNPIPFNDTWMYTPEKAMYLYQRP